MISRDVNFFVDKEFQLKKKRTIEIEGESYTFDYVRISMAGSLYLGDDYEPIDTGEWEGHIILGSGGEGEFDIDVANIISNANLIKQFSKIGLDLYEICFNNQIN